MNKIIIETIPHDKQSYETVGDYRRDKEGVMHIWISDMGNEKYEALVAIHELMEVYLTEFRGIKEKEITDFDLMFERDRAPGNVDEPGDDPIAPYQNEHCYATAVERMLCAALDLSWKQYEDKVNSLYRKDI